MFHSSVELSCWPGANTVDIGAGMDTRGETTADFLHCEASYAKITIIKSDIKTHTAIPNLHGIVDTIHCTFDERAVGSQVAKASAKQGVSAPATATTPPSSKQTATSVPASHLPLLASKDPLLDDFDDGNTPAVSQLVFGGSGSEPSNYKQAMQTTDAVSWRTAVQSEIDSLIDNGTFEEVQGNVRGKLLTTRWVFTRKDHETDPSRRYKARLVARGDHQREGIDYDVFSISSPVTTATTVRAVLSVAVPNRQVDWPSCWPGRPLFNRRRIMPDWLPQMCPFLSTQHLSVTRSLSESARQHLFFLLLIFRART